VTEENSTKFPPIKQPNQTVTSNINDMIKPKTMLTQANQMMKSNNDYFYKQNRPPSSRSNAMSEIEINSAADTRSLGGGLIGNSQQPRRNNLL
jgi:hypothetical protein